MINKDLINSGLTKSEYEDRKSQYLIDPIMIATEKIVSDLIYESNIVIADECNKRNLTQKAFAKLLGISSNTLLDIVGYTEGWTGAQTIESRIRLLRKLGYEVSFTIKPIEKE